LPGLPDVGIRRRAIDLSVIAREVAVKVQATDTGRMVEWVVAPRIKVFADPGLMRLMLETLLGNAFRYSVNARPARIEIGYRRPVAGRIEIFVRDNGNGFDTHAAAALFSPFPRLRDVFGSGGTGIGLANVRRIIESHGGAVHAQGAPGKGAAFIFVIPDWSDLVAHANPANHHGHHGLERGYLAGVGHGFAKRPDAPAAYLERRVGGVARAGSASRPLNAARVARMVGEATLLALPRTRVLVLMIALSGLAALLFAA
jgi:hypothetical protein